MRVCKESVSGHCVNHSEQPMPAGAPRRPPCTWGTPRCVRYGAAWYFGTLGYPRVLSQRGHSRACRTHRHPVMTLPLSGLESTEYTASGCRTCATGRYTTALNGTHSTKREQDGTHRTQMGYKTMIRVSGNTSTAGDPVIKVQAVLVGVLRYSAVLRHMRHTARSVPPEMSITQIFPLRQPAGRAMPCLPALGT